MTQLEKFLYRYSNIIPAWLLKPKQDAIIPFLPGVAKPPQGNFPEPAIPKKVEQLVQIANSKHFITPTALKIIAPRTPSIDEHARLINILGSKYGLLNKEVFPEYISQVAHESAEFMDKQEILIYTASRLVKVFPKYFKSLEIAKEYAFNSQKIGNRVYANRMGNGPESSGDGYKNRGGGYIMLTGADIWKLYAKYISKTVEETQHLVRTTIEYALDSSMWYFSIYRSLNDEAARNEFELITRIINGGIIGYEDRKVYYNRALKAIN